MRNKIFKIICLMFVSIMILSGSVFAAGKLDPYIPTFMSSTLGLNNDGTASFTAPTYDGGWKRFALQLLKRVSSITTTGGITTVIYQYKTSGSIVYVKPDEVEATLKFPSVGYYQFQIRGENLEGNYGEWMRMSGGEAYDYDYEGLAINEDDISIGGNSSSGSGGGSTGPGIAQTSQLPAGYQYAVVGPNGEIMYYYGGNASNWQYNSMGQYAMSGNNQYYGPGYVNNGNAAGQVMFPNTGVSNYPQVQTPNVYGNQIGNSTYNPNMYSGYAGGYMMPQINQNMQIGWQVDNNGRFYYQGNGSVLKSTWYLIDGAYYRFNDNGYALTNQWFKDQNTNLWYYLAGDGKMLIGWQNINNVWYYFKPENGNGYGAMYANTSIFINDPTWGSGQYAFDSNGAMVKNAWYNNAYYGNDGRKAN